MSFMMMKKKKYKFQVVFELEELSSVPFINVILFAKVRLLDGGNFSEISSREEVTDHCVKWNSKFNFLCKMSANANTGFLDPCICRVSVRKEMKGGRSFQKLGFADLNLAEYAGSGCTSRRYLLEGYTTKLRQDNSILKVTVDMTLLSGDPCFKVPSVKQFAVPGELQDELLPLDRKAADDCSNSSVASGSSGFGSLPRKNRPSVLSLVELASGIEQDPGIASKEEESDAAMGHSRNSSYASQHSKVSGYGSLPTHSRQSSAESGHVRNLSSGSGMSDFADRPKLPDRKRKLKQDEIKESRVDDTRVDADELINQLLQDTNLEADESAESSGLHLFISKDGSTALGGNELKSRGNFEQVVIDHS